MSRKRKNSENRRYRTYTSWWDWFWNCPINGSRFRFGPTVILSFMIPLMSIFACVFLVWIASVGR